MTDDGARLRVGVLGAGQIAQAAHLEAIRKAVNCELHALCDRAPDLLDVRSEDQHGKAVVAGLEGSRGARAHPHRVERLELHELVVELDAPGARQDHVDLLGRLVAVGERLALPGLHDEVVHARLLGAEVRAGKARLLGLREPMFDRAVLHLAQVLLRIAHGA